MRLKDDTVKISQLSPGLLFGLMVLRDVMQEHVSPMVITSANDGKHGANSLHYANNAADVRIWALDADEVKEVVEEANDRLGPDWDVIAEKDHIHIECQPKRR